MEMVLHQFVKYIRLQMTTQASSSALLEEEAHAQQYALWHIISV